MFKGTEDHSSHVVKCHQIQYSCTKKNMFMSFYKLSSKNVTSLGVVCNLTDS